MPESRHFTLEGARRDDPDVARSLAALPGDVGRTATHWFRAVRALGPDVLELMHDGQATACIGDLPFCYVAAFRSHVNVGFYFGTVLPDPHGVLIGSGRFMRHVRVGSSLGDGDAALHALLAAAYADARSRAGGAVE